MVTSVEENATRAGVKILSEGGNAVDAAVAVGYALAVTHPSAGNLGGGGFLLVHPADGRTLALDFRERAPAKLTAENFRAMIARQARDPAASGIPGSVAGLNLAHQRFGKLPLAQVMAPAIALARDGHALGRRQALVLGWNWVFLREDPAARAQFGRGGRALRQGELLVQPDLAHTLTRIAEHGDAGFYQGETARLLAAAMGSRGLITEQDLRDYRAVFRDPLSFDYRGYRVDVMPPPSAGGVAVVQMLLALQELKAWESPVASPDNQHRFIEVARRAHAQRRFGVVDPDSAENWDEAAHRARWLAPRSLLDTPPVLSMTTATKSRDVHPLYDAAVKELEHTTHFSVADAAGNVVSCTTTLSAGFGARYVAKGTGVVMNNSVAAFGTAGEDVPKPGRRMTSSMSPTLVFRGDEPVLVLGSPGGDTIPNTVVQVLRNVIDYGMTIDAAIDAPRIHHGFIPDTVGTERERPLPPAVVKELKRRGHQLHPRGAIGDANDLLLSGGVAWGFADLREGGLAAGPAAHSATPATSTAARSATLPDAAAPTTSKIQPTK